MPDLQEPFPEDRKFFPTDMAQLVRWLPWLRMFRAFRIAIDYKKMFVAFIAIIVWMLSSYVLNRAFFKLDQTEFASQSATRLSEAPTTDALSRRIASLLIRKHQIRVDSKDPVATFLSYGVTITLPASRVFNSSLNLVTTESSRVWWFSLLQTMLGVTISALFGTAICRMAAREATGHDRSLIRDLKFSTKQFPSTIIAPLVVLAAIIGIGAIIWIAGLAGRIPVAGEILLGLVWGVLILLGFLMSLILLGMLLGWPLMFASSVVERNDAGDAMSRSLSYLWNRPWYALFLFLIACGYGAILLMVVEWLIGFSVGITFSAVASGLGMELSRIPTSVVEFRNQNSVLTENPVASWLIQFWTGLIALIPAVFAFSFFWSSTTVGYLLLRKCEDGTPLDLIDLSDSTNSERSDLPVVGIPAAERREEMLRKQTEEQSDENP